MKIDKILEDIIPNRQEVQLNRPLTGKNLDRNNTMGKGFFSVARPDRDPHMIKKYKYRMGAKDPYDAYINYIIDDNLTSNPCFPRIYNIKKITDSDGNVTHKYTVEKLISGEEVSNEELESVMDRIFTEEVKADIIEYASTDSRGKVRENPEFHDGIASRLNGCLRGFQLNGTIIDENMTKAIIAIRKMVRDGVGMVDLHSDNLMYRRTKYGVQPVLSDPIA
jgi:hypothetical protein